MTHSAPLSPLSARPPAKWPGNVIAFSRHDRAPAGEGGLAFFGMTPCFVLQAVSRDPTPFTTAASPVLTPDLPPAIVFNTRVKWEGTNHCNYVQWVQLWWLSKVWQLDGSVMDSYHTTYQWDSVRKCFMSPRVNLFVDWVQWIDISNMQLMTTTQMALWADNADLAVPKAQACYSTEYQIRMNWKNYHFLSKFNFKTSVLSYCLCSENTELLKWQLRLCKWFKLGGVREALEQKCNGMSCCCLMKNHCSSSKCKWLPEIWDFFLCKHVRYLQIWCHLHKFTADFYPSEMSGVHDAYNERDLGIFS